MNKFIKQQLEKIKLPSSNYNENSTQIIFYKQINNKELLKVNGFYRIKVSNFLLKESKLSSNWNNGVFLKCNVLDICVIKILNNMIQVNAVELDETTNTQAENKYMGFWIPVSEITILGEYKV